MRIRDKDILMMRANRNLLVELTCAIQTPNIPASIRQRAQEILSQYPALPEIEKFKVLARSASKNLGKETTSCRLVKEKTWRSSVTEFLSDAEKTKNACVYAGLAGSTLALATSVFILLAH